MTYWGSARLPVVPGSARVDILTRGGLGLHGETKGFGRECSLWAGRAFTDRVRASAGAGLLSRGLLCGESFVAGGFPGGWTFRKRSDSGATAYSMRHVCRRLADAGKNVI